MLIVTPLLVLVLLLLPVLEGVTDLPLLLAVPDLVGARLAAGVCDADRLRDGDRDLERQTNPAPAHGVVVTVAVTVEVTLAVTVDVVYAVITDVVSTVTVT